MTIKVTGLAYVRMQVTNLDEASAFFTDFGLIEAARTDGICYFRGYGPERFLLSVHAGEPQMLALGFDVGSRADLETIAALMGSTVSESTEPGGGSFTAIIDPDGNRVELVHGIQPREPLTVKRAVMNSGSERYRRTGEFCRPKAGPSHVLRLGHVVLTTPQPISLARWYRETFGFLVSDEVFVEREDNILLSFNRVDRGSEYVDHHLFQTMPGPAGGIHHVSFEIMDTDDLHCGHAHLASKGYRHMWGIGRHKQGSQIFDYWVDSFGVMYEHWTDTDLLNANSKSSLASVEDSIGPWGPAMPPEFLTQVG